MAPPPTRESLASRNLSPHRSGRNWTKADIFLWEEAGRRLAIKDYARRPAWVRATLGRCLISRECSAYERLRGIPGIPAFAGRIDPCAFAVELIEGRDLSRVPRGALPASFFSRLLALLEAVHRAGVAHGDLHHRDVILSSSGQPFLVDFSTAVFRRRGASRPLFEAACASDRRAALKLKSRHAPGDVTPEERQALDHPPRWYRIGKALRRMLSGGGAKKRPAR
jgi:predicted Ser/Thr protein kinase